MTSLCISSFKSIFPGTCWSDLSDLYLYKLYDGFTIYHTANCRPPIFFGELLAKKNSIFGFLEGKGYIFESCLYSMLGYANIFALIDGKPFSWVACCDIFRHFFSGQFSTKKAEIFDFFFETDLTLPTAYLKLTLIFYERICRVRLLYA